MVLASVFVKVWVLENSRPVSPISGTPTLAVAFSEKAMALAYVIVVETW